MKKFCCTVLALILVLLASVSMAEVNKPFTFQDIAWGTKLKNTGLSFEWNSQVFTMIPFGAEQCGLDFQFDFSQLGVKKESSRGVNIAGFENCSYDVFFVRTCTGSGLCDDDDAVLYGVTVHLYDFYVPEALRTPTLWEDLVTKLVNVYGPADKIVSNGDPEQEYLIWKGQQETWLIYNLGRHKLTYYCGNGTQDLFNEGQAWLDQQVANTQSTWLSDLSGL